MSTAAVTAGAGTGRRMSPATAGRGILAIVLGGQAMATIDGSIVNVALPSIRAGLRIGAAEVQLVPIAYLLAFASVVVTAARLGDRRGQPQMFRLGLAGFTAASLICGLAPDGWTLIAARLGQGGLGAFMVAQVISLIQLNVEGAARARAIALYSLILAAGVAVGQVLGGLLVTADIAGLGWRPIFLVNLPIGVVLLVAAQRLPMAGRSTNAVRLDLVGVGTLAVSVAAVVGVLTLGRQQSWPAWSVVTLIMGAAGLVGFVAYEWRLLHRGREPLLDLRVLKPSGVPSGLAACCLVMGAYSGFLFTLTLYLQSGLGFTALRAGSTVVAFAAGFAAVSLTWTRIPAAVTRWLPVAGPLVFAAGLTAVVLLTGRHWPVLPAMVLLAAAGAGHAASFSPLFARVAAHTAPALASALSALASMGTLLAGVISISTIGGLYLATSSTGPGSAHLALVRAALIIDAALLSTSICALWSVTRPAAPSDLAA